MTFALSDKKWGQPVYGTASGTVTWSVVSYSGLSFDSSLYTLADFEEALRSAFRTWENVAGIDFEFTAATGTADVTLSMTALPGSTIGQATTSFFVLDGIDEMISAEIELDSNEQWAPFGQTALNFFAVAVHEIGHVLGLDHVSDTSQIMYPVIYKSELGTGDLAGARFIYGGRTNEDGAENLVGSFARDTLFGEGGNDTLLGSGGSDLLVGGTEADTLSGEDGDDLLVGESASSRDAFAAQAFRLFSVALDRDPGGPGHTYWTNSLAAGTQLLNVANFVVSTAEFQSSYGQLNNADFVEALYHDALGRDPAPSGLAFWTNALNSGQSRGKAIVAISESTEYIDLAEASSFAFTTSARQRDYSDDVFRVYDGLLDRAPGTGGLLFWSDHLLSGGKTSSIVKTILNSAEYDSAFGDETNQEFVSRLYQTSLDRPGSESGIDWWTSALNNGFSRANAATFFFESAEAQAKSIPAVDAYFRSGAAADFDDVLDGGTGDDILIGGLGADTFIFNSAETGSDVVADLDPWDTVQMNGFAFSELSEVPELLRQEGDDVVFESGGQMITFLDTLLSDFA